MNVRKKGRLVAATAGFAGISICSLTSSAATLTWNAGNGTWDKNQANTPWTGLPWTDGSDAAFAAAAGNTNNSTVGSQTINVADNVSPTSMTFNSGAGAFRFTTANGSVITNTGGGTTNYVHNKGSYADFATSGLLNFSNAPAGGLGSVVGVSGAPAILVGATLGNNDFILAQAGPLVAPTYAATGTAGFTTVDNELVTGSFTTATSTTTNINSLKFDGTPGRVVSAGSTLNIYSGMILTQAGTTETITGNKTISASSGSGEINLVANGNLVLNMNVTSGTSITKSGAGTVFATGSSNSTTGALRILEGTYQFGNNGSGGELTGAGASVVIGSSSLLNVRHATNSVTFAPNISGSGAFQLNYTGTSAQTYTLSGNNANLLGGVTVNTAVGGNATAFNVSLIAGSATAFGSGTLTITSNAATSGAIANATPGATIASTADIGGFALTTGLLSDGGYGAASALTNSGAAATLTLKGTTAQSYAGVVQDGAGALGLALTGPGTQTLAGNANSYSGGTTVSNGRLRLTNTSGSATGTGTVVVNAAALDGTGSASGNVTVTNGGLLAPAVNSSGNFGTPGTLSLGTTGGLTLNTAALDFDLATTPVGASDEILTGGAFTPTAADFSFNELGGSLALGTPYTLVAGFTNAPDITGVTGSVLQGGFTPTFSVNGNALQVTFSAVPEPASLTLLGTGALALGFRHRRRGNAC